jgi:hypothetical protein
MTKYYTTHEAAALQKIKLNTVQKQLKRDADKPQKERHYPNAVKRGRDWLIPEQDIEPQTDDLSPSKPTR